MDAQNYRKYAQDEVGINLSARSPYENMRILIVSILSHRLESGLAAA
jgi:hypothetical protein